MSKPTKLIVNCSTGEQTVVELTDEEISGIEAARLAEETAQAERQAEEEAKAEAKISAIAKLTALGLTEDEAYALVN